MLLQSGVVHYGQASELPEKKTIRELMIRLRTLFQNVTYIYNDCYSNFTSRSVIKVETKCILNMKCSIYLETIELVCQERILQSNLL